jgi:hypothetical protein
MSPPPPAVASANDGLAQPYLRAVKLTHNYHFASNRVGNPDAYLVVHLEDGDGKHLRTVCVPDPNAPPYVQRRQALLLRFLVDDQPVQPPTSERIYPPGQTPPRLSIWEMNEPGRLHLAEIAEMEVPRNRPVFRPSDWSLIVVRSCARHLCRVHGAERAHVVRYSRDAVHPSILVGQPGEAAEVPESLYAAFRAETDLSKAPESISRILPPEQRGDAEALRRLQQAAQPGTLVSDYGRFPR